MSKKKILIIFILGILGLSTLQAGFAQTLTVESSIDNMQNKYANNLLRVNLVKTTDNKINLILHTTKSFDNPIYPVRKSDFEYIVLLPETYHSITSKPDFTDLMDDIRDVEINLVPYIGIKTNNGYTKLVIQTKKRDLDLIVSNESLELAKVIDKELEDVIEDKRVASQKTIDDITPVPLVGANKTKTPVKTVNVKKAPSKKKVVRTYRKTAKKPTNSVNKTASAKTAEVSKPKKVLEIVKKETPQEEVKTENKPANEAINTPVTRQNVQNQISQKRRVQRPQRRPMPKKQSPLAGLLGNKWLYIIGIPLILILLALKNMQKAKINQDTYNLYENYDEEEEYSSDENYEQNSDYQQDDPNQEPGIFAGLKNEMRQNPDIDDDEYGDESEIYQEQEEPQEEIEEELLYDEDEQEVEVLTPQVDMESNQDDFEELDTLEEIEAPDGLEEILPEELEEVSLDEETPEEQKISQEELETIMQEEHIGENFEIDEQNDLFEDIEVEEEFSLDEQNDLYEDIEIQDEVMLDPDLVSKAFEEAKDKNLQAQPEMISGFNRSKESQEMQESQEVSAGVAIANEQKIKEEQISDESIKTAIGVQGLNILDSKELSFNKGFYLVQLHNQKALIGFINNEFDVLHRFKQDVVGELRIKKTEEKPNEDIYLVEAKPWRALISVSENVIKTKLIL